MRTPRLLTLSFAAVLLVLVLAAGSAARDAAPGLERPTLPQPGSSQAAPPALATSPTATQRSFVSGLGSDANPCSRTAPCRNFTKAISETLPNGEVIVLDSAGYGPFTIDKSIDIIAPAGVYAGVTAFSGSAVTVNAAATDKVVLRGLTLNGLGGGTGVHVLQVGTLYLQQLVAKKFTSNGLAVNVPAASTPHVFVQDTLAQDNGSVGLWFITGATRATVDASRFEGNVFGLVVYSGAKVSARDTLAAGGNGDGFLADGIGTELNLERALAANNSQRGIGSTAGATVRISESMVTNNATGLSGTIVSWGNNRVAGNTFNGAPTSTIPQV